MALGSRLAKLLSGRQPAQPSRLTSDDPNPFGPDFERKLEMLAMLSRRVNSPLFRAERRGKRRGSGVEFADYRDYATGDDFRFIDPNAAMRFDRLLVRLYEEEEDQSLYLLVDTSQSMGHCACRKLDCAKRLAAGLAYLGLLDLSRVTVVALRDGRNLNHPTTRGRGQFLSILRFLRGLEATGTTQLEFAIRRFAREHRRRGIAVLFSDLFDPDGFERGVDALRYERFEPHLVHITDDREPRLDLTGDVVLVDSETGHEAPATVTSALCERWQVLQAELAERAWRHCRTRGLGYYRTEVSCDFDQTIRAWLGQQGLRTT